MVSNGLYDINCEEGSHSNSLSYFSHVSLSFLATLYLQNAKKEHVKVFVAWYIFKSTLPTVCFRKYKFVSHILQFNFHFHANVLLPFYHPPTKLWNGNVFTRVCLSTRGPNVTLPTMHCTWLYRPRPWAYCSPYQTWDLLLLTSGAHHRRPV